MHALLIAESTPKIMRLAGFARTVLPEIHWQTATTGAFTKTVERFDTKTLRATFKAQHKQHINRIIALAADAQAIYVATDPTPKGELLAADVADHILDRYPDRIVRRLLIDRMTSEAFRHAHDNFVAINRKKADAMRVSRVINFLVSSRVKTLTGKPGGRAVLPFLSELSRMIRPGESRIRLQLASGVCFESGFGSADLVRRVYDRVKRDVPDFSVRSDDFVLEPPGLYDTWTLQRDGCRILGARAIEIASQVEQLYHGGYIARAQRIDADYVGQATQELVAFGDEPSGSVEPGRLGIVPTNLKCLPSDVPHPVRPVYRLVWANTLCSFGRAMRVSRETAWFVLDGVEFTSESYVPLSAGFDHVSFGLFYRRGRIGNGLGVDAARMFGSGPFEHEVVSGLTMRLSSPAFVLKAAENLGYIGFDGPEVAIVERGRHVLEVLSSQVPQVLDRGLFDATDTFLESHHDASELLEPWARWSDEVLRAAKSRSVAYLR